MMSAQLSQTQMNPAVRIKYEQRNPKKAKSGIRYEGYKRAQTLEEMIALEEKFVSIVTNHDRKEADFRWDLKRGFVKILEDSAKLSFESVPAKKTMTQDEKNERKRVTKHKNAQGDDEEILLKAQGDDEEILLKAQGDDEEILLKAQGVE
jgi:F0F1-type ATP synthase epsilon subunit